MNESEIDVYVDRWTFWCASRRLLAPTVKSNILARLQPSKVRAHEPDAFMDAEMPFFNAAVHGLCEQQGNEEEAAAFIGFYWYRATPQCGD